ncbi:hypothetical protein QOZ83_02325 [Romboutsia sedimentorum]|uniref:hypothetical protein n=1 Tax=Romboutsia sedimentorum TaxID=1368474 RepID=UPI0024DEC976|nr:hypothetical protein [Romboutsia sedimentorum]MDK2584682.1 hypothetical protein [Romboutsia sedimentorum]
MNNYNFKNAFPDTPLSFKNKVSDTLNNLPDKKEYCEMENKTICKKISFKKRVIVTLAATFVLGTTALAAGKVFSIVGGSSNIPTYTSLPTIQQVKDDFGFSPKLVGKFNNGYTYDKAKASKNEALDEKGNSLGKSKSLGFIYKKGNDEVNLDMENKMLGEKSKKEVLVDNYKDIDLYYETCTTKFLPEDYEMTEQDKKDEASGKYEFSVGSKKIEISRFTFLNWEQDGIYYYFMTTDSDLTKDELVKMAHEVIDAK